MSVAGIKMTDSTNLSREQKEFLEECLTEFANRFSDDDEDYKKSFDRGIPKPPILCPWYGRPRLTAARSGHRNYQGRFDRDRYDSRDRDSNPRHERQREGQNRYRPY